MVMGGCDPRDDDNTDKIKPKRAAYSSVKERTMSAKIRNPKPIEEHKFYSIKSKQTLGYALIVKI